MNMWKWTTHAVKCGAWTALAGSVLAGQSAHARPLSLTPTNTPFIDISSTGTSITGSPQLTPTNSYGYFLWMYNLLPAGFTGNALFGTTVPYNIQNNQAILVASTGAVLWGGDGSISLNGHRYAGTTNQNILTMTPSNSTTSGNGGETGPDASPVQFICPYWDNLVPQYLDPYDLTTGSFVYWQVINGNLIIQWTNMLENNGSSDYNNSVNNVGTFEVIIYSNTNPNGPFCDFVYQDTFFVADGGNDGSSASIGYRDWGTHPGITGGVDGVQYSYNTASVAGYVSAANPLLPNALRLEVAGGSIDPSGYLTLNTYTGVAGDTLIATCSTRTGENPASSGITVSLDATSVNGGTVTLHDDGVYPDAVAGDGIYSGTVTYGSGVSIGLHTLVATIRDAQGRSSPSTETVAYRGPSSDGGYAITKSTGGTIVPGTTDTGVNNWYGDQSTATDAHFAQVTFPFTFNLYGTPYTTAWVSPHGLLIFSAPSNASGVYTDQPYADILPSINFDGGLVPYWNNTATDQDTSTGQTGVFTSTTGTAPNRVFNIEYRVKFAGGFLQPDGTTAANYGYLNYEIQLYEGQTRFDFVYGSYDSGTGNPDDGGGATIGCQQISPQDTTGTPLYTNYDTPVPLCFNCPTVKNFPPAGTVLTFTQSGVCCRGTTCNSTVAQSACTGSGSAGASFSPTSGACNSAGVRTSPCCYADFNKSGSVTVQDIFDYLAAWFARNPFAVVGGDGTGAAPTVQSIFDYLAAWFAKGC